jgi:hypothetical protein
MDTPVHNRRQSNGEQVNRFGRAGFEGKAKCGFQR